MISSPVHWLGLVDTGLLTTRVLSKSLQWTCVVVEEIVSAV